MSQLATFYYEENAMTGNENHLNLLKLACKNL